MRKILHLAGRFFTAFFAFLFVVSLVIVIIWYGVIRQLSQTHFYTQALSDLDVYSRLPILASDLLPSKIPIDPCLVVPSFCGNTSATTGFPSISVSVTPRDWQVILEMLLPPEQIKIMVDSVLDQGIALIFGDSERIRLPLMELKSNLGGLSGEARIEQLIAKLPSCDETVIQKFIAFAPDLTIPICIPPFLTESLTPQVLQQYLYMIPDVLVISLPPATLASKRLILHCLAWLPVVPLLFLIFVALFGIRSFKGGIRWGGFLLFLGGLLALVVGAVLRFSAAGMVSLFFGLKTDRESGLSDFSRQLGEYCLNHLSGGIILPAFVILLVGLLLWTGSALMQNRAGGLPKSPSDTFKDSV